MDNPQEVKKALLAALVEKGDYSTILKHLDTDAKEEKANRTYKLIEPISAFADLLTQNVDGVFTDKLSTKIDAETKAALKELSEAITTAKETLQDELQSLLSTTKEEMVAEHLERYQAAEKTLSDAMMQAAIEVASARATEILPTLADAARLNEDEISDIIDQAALSVESQISDIIGEYIAEQKVSVDQITGFADAVRKLLPQERQITWNEIVGKPDISQGGTNANLIRKMIAEAGTGGGASTFIALTDTPASYTGDGGKLLAVKGDETGVEFIAAPSGSGDVIGPASSVNDNIALFNGVTGKLIKDSGVKTTDFATAAQGALADSATQPADIANFETTTQLNNRDTANRDRANHTGTQTASTISDFDTEVSNNTDVAANTAARHAAVTVADSAEIDFTLTGQQISASIVAGSIDESKLDASVNASLDLADSASQPGHTHVAADITDFDTEVANNSAVAANTAKISNATHTGDVTGATALTIANGAVTLAKMANLAQDQFIGRTTASTGVPETATITAAARTVLDDTTVADMVNTLGGAASTGTGGLVRTGSPALITPSIEAITVSGGTLTLPTGASSNLVSRVSTDTLTNKRITSRITSEASSATPTINTDNTDVHRITALATNITSFTTNLSGTPTTFQKLIIEVTPTATRTVTFGASFEDGNVHTLPTEFTGTDTVIMGFMWNTITSKWKLVALDQ